MPLFRFNNKKMPICKVKLYKLAFFYYVDFFTARFSKKDNIFVCKVIDIFYKNETS